MFKLSFILLLSIVHTSTSFNILNDDVILLDQDSSYYRVDTACQTTDSSSGIARMVFSLSSDSIVMSETKECLGLTNLQDYKLYLVDHEPKRQDLKTVVLPRATFTGRQTTTSCKLVNRKDGHSSHSLGYGERFDVLAASKCTTEGGYNGKEYNGQLAVVGLAPGTNYTILNQRNKTIKSFGFTLPDISKKGYFYTDQGKMILNLNFAEITSPKLLTEYTTDKKFYSVPTKSIVYKNEATPLVKNLQVVFDMNFPFIGLKNTIWVELLNLLSANGLVCDQKQRYSKCNYIGRLEDLPPIVLTLDDATSTKITISPEQYLTKQDSSAKQEADLNLYPLGGVFDLQSESAVVHNYDNLIILGNYYMSHRFVTFDVSNQEKPVVRIYEKLPETAIPRELRNKTLLSEHGVLIAIVIVVLIIVLVIIVFACYKKRQANKLREELRKQDGAPYVRVGL